MAGINEFQQEEEEENNTSSKFEWDENSQLYYHSSTGFYFNPQEGWYYSSRDGLYYKFEDGNYVLLNSDLNPVEQCKASNNYERTDSDKFDVDNQCMPVDGHKDGEGLAERLGTVSDECTTDDFQCVNNHLEGPPPPSEWLEDTLIDLYLSGYPNQAASTASDITMDSMTNDIDALDMTASGQNDAYELEEGEWIPDDLGSIDLSRNITDEGASWEEDNWRAQYGQVTEPYEELALDIQMVDLWDWKMIRETRTSKGGKHSIAKLVGRLVKSSSKLHPSVPSGGIRLKTAPIREAHRDLIRVTSGQIYRLKRPSSQYLASVLTYDSSNPTRDWGFPPLSLNSEIQQLPRIVGPGAFEEASLPSEHPHVLKKAKQQYAYRDRAAERRTLHGGFGVGPGQKKAPNDADSAASSPTSACPEEAAAESLNISFGAGSYARRLLENMGWKEGETLGKSTKGLVEPLQAIGNKGNAGLWIIQILGKLGNWRRVLQVIEWIQLRERFKSHKLRFIYTTALNVLGKSRRPVEALNLFQSMQQQMCTYPDLVAYRCIAVTLGQAGHMKELFHVIDCMRSLPKKKFKTGFLQKWDPRLEPDVVVYNAVLNACVKRKNWEGAFWVLQQLKQQGQPPSSTTYGLVMEVMLACGKYNLVHDFFRKMQKTCIPNSLTYKVLLNTLWREGKIDEAILAIEEMERRGIIGTASLYYDLARCLCSAQRCQEALMQIDKLCRVANKPLVVTFTGLIQACVDSGNAKNGAYIFEHMQKFCSPNLVTYNIMLKAFLNQGMFEEAKQLFLRLLENSHTINSKSDYKEKVTPDLYTFNTMLEGCAAEEKWDDLEWVYVEMLKSGYHFNSKRHLQIILDASNAGKGELLEMVWMHLVQGDQIPPFLLISQMFRIKLEQGNFTAALSCFACHPSINSQAFSTKWWLKFFADNVHSLEKDTFVKLMHSANSLVARTDAQNLILQNLKLSCMEFLSQQMASNELSLTEVADRTHCTSTTAFVY